MLIRLARNIKRNTIVHLNFHRNADKKETESSGSAGK